MDVLVLSPNAETLHEITIPYGILFMISNYLSKSDWKALRLLSKEFNRFATELPFKELWFSPHAEDLKVFRRVCEHPEWAKQVMTIIYDITLFLKAKTLAELYSEAEILRELRVNSFSQTEGYDPNLERDRLNETLHQGPVQYIQYAESQGSVSRLDLLSTGMGWAPEEAYGNQSRSPLERSWGRAWPVPPDMQPVSGHTIRTILTTIAVMGASLKDFSTGEGDQMWERCQIDNAVHAFGNFEPRILESIETIFSGFTTLKLRLGVVEGLGKAQFTPLSRLLKKAEQLENLVLEFDEPDIDDIDDEQDFGEHEWETENRVDLETLFGDTAETPIAFPRLQFLGLRMWEVSAKSMMEVLQRHRGSLSGLKLDVQYVSCLKEERRAFVDTIDSLALDRVESWEWK